MNLTHVQIYGSLSDKINAGYVKKLLFMQIFEGGADQIGNRIYHIFIS